MDPAAIEASWDLAKTLDSDRARTLLAVLGLPDGERWAFISRMFVRDDGEWLAEVLADVEQDLIGRTRERLIAGLRAVRVCRRCRPLAMLWA